MGITSLEIRMCACIIKEMEGLSNHKNWSDCCLGNFILQADNTGVVSIATPKLQLSSANNGLLASIQIKMKIIITQHTLIPKDLMM